MSLLGTVCIECFNLKKCDGGKKVRCSEFKFKEHLEINHPFVTLPRNCSKFDDDPEVVDDKKEDNK